MTSVEPEGRPVTEEHQRLRDSPHDGDVWRAWGPFVSGRQWGTVREDYSADGDAWAFFPFDHAHARAYRWGEDGIAGVCDRYGFLNLAVAMWNGQDDRLKERLFGLTNGEGNHGEDAKEYWWHLDATPTHSWAQYLYRYPQAAFPYAALREESAARGHDVPEFQLFDTGALDEDRFFDVVTTHAKAAPGDLCVVVEATNHGPEAAPLDLVPQLWFRNTWAWGRDDRTPVIEVVESTVPGTVALRATHDHLGVVRLVAEGLPEVLVCDNETHVEAVFGEGTSLSEHPKDAVDRAVVHADPSLLATDGRGTKVALRYHFDAVAPGATVRIRLRLHDDDWVGGVDEVDPLGDPFGAGFDGVLAARRTEADRFYASVIPDHVGDEERHVARRAFAGLNWCKQLYRYDVREWLEGDPAGPPPPDSRLAREPLGRNTSWSHLALADIISMPDEWEYPWFAAWDLAFHTVAIAHMDPQFAKNQLLLMCREWSQHPNGQLPAYEWSFGDVNPPVHAWAAWHVYVLDGSRDRGFLIRVFTKLLFNFSWWLNRKDSDGSNLFEGGFLGMDNISVFDRSREVPDGWRLEQSDATSWMAFTCLQMLRIALELSRGDRDWDGLATTFLEHFFSIAEAMETFGTEGVSLWDETDEFFYDVLVDGDGHGAPVRVRSLVGLLPLIAVANVPAWAFEELTDFTSRLRWLQDRRPDLTDSLLHSQDGDVVHNSLTPVVRPRLEAILRRLFDEEEFLSPHGIRSLSASYRGGAEIAVGDTSVRIQYDPGESSSGMFGGNSNWRGPVWFPTNVLVLDALLVMAEGADGDLVVEFPTGSGHRISLEEAAIAVRGRLISLFLPRADGRRPGTPREHPAGPLWDVHPTFSEHFNGDDGTGLGASHQCGWTALVAHLICTSPEDLRKEIDP
ncbi:MGH1-like glycoside hydrolase domain-containing protein [Knoellia aerolata]|uniref:Glucosidase n=1 Tax=Knoellia aerolata DSM 18566 TaxID=1385519 RepID=A0A0A0K1B6_9MICO|nr:glucosidase [Knoellia aerolata]KGN42112.1 glucosidase [Knoellia aerolata DSM 18566]